LRADSEHERWDGFWGGEEYFARCTRVDGTVQWYRIEDIRDVLQFRAGSAGRATPSAWRDSSDADGTRRTVLVSQRHGGRAMLVGVSRRRRRARSVR